MASRSGSRPQLVLVINNNPDGKEGRYTPMVVEHVLKFSLRCHEVRTLEAVDKFARETDDDADVGLIITCGSPLWLTRLIDIEAHMAKTTAAMLHFPNAPVVGICFGMQLLAQLYGGKLIDSSATGYSPGIWTSFQSSEHAHRLLEGLGPNFLQWATNSVFVQQLPPRFVAPIVDALGRNMAMQHMHEHVYGFQFHPEMVDVEETCINSIPFERILALAGHNRRIKMCSPACGQASPWQCTTQCRYRAAIKSATRDNKGSGSVAPSLSRVLAERKREALSSLRLMHCKHGGITEEALEGAVSALRSLAEEAAPAALASAGDAVLSSVREVRAENSGPAVEGALSFHAADLRLREVVTAALRDNRSSDGAVARCDARESSCSRRAQSGSVNSSGKSAEESRRSCTSTTFTGRDGQRSISSSSAGSQLGRAAGASLRPAAAAAGYPSTAPPSGAAAGESGAERCSVHAADLRLRRAVAESLPTDGERRVVAGALSEAKRSKLAELRREALEGDGWVTLAAVEEAVVALRELSVRPAGR